MSDGAHLVEPAGLAQGVPYASAAVAPAGARVVFLAGACPLDASGQTAAVGVGVPQTAVCVDDMKAALMASGAELQDEVFVRVLVASNAREDLAATWDVVHRTFDPHEPPGTLQGVTVLGWPDQLVEVEVVAAIRSE